MILTFTCNMDSKQGRLLLLIVTFCSTLVRTTSMQSTPWFCTDPLAFDSTVEINRKLPSCPVGYAVEIDDVIYESTIDGKCSGSLYCSVNNKNALAFACNGKQICTVDIRNFRFQINSTCGATVRFFSKFRCLPVLYDQKDYFCQSPNIRNPNQGDLTISCQNNYHLHIKMALIGISVKSQDLSNRNRWKCDKNTYWLCNHYIPDAYRNVCQNQLHRNSPERCLIRYSDRPQLRNCPHGSSSNFSIVEYVCVPGEQITDGLPRFDICAPGYQQRLTATRGFIHSPLYPSPMSKYLSCQKQLFVRRDARLRLFMLEKSMEYYHELSFRLTNTEPNVSRRLEKNELFDEIKEQDNLVEIDLRTNHVSGGHFLLYFQIDSRISDYAPLVLENDRVTIDPNRRSKIVLKRDWGVVIGCLIGLLVVFLVVLIVIIVCRILKCRRAKSLKYMATNTEDNEHLQRLNTSKASPIREPIRIEHPHMNSSSGNRLNMTNSQSKFMSEKESDRETLLRQAPRNNSESNTYLEAKPIESRRNDRPTSELRTRPIAPLAAPEDNRRRTGKHLYDAPMASTETLDVGTSSSELNRRPQQAPPRIPPPRLDLAHPMPSAPPLPHPHEERYQQTNFPVHPRVNQLQHRNQHYPQN